MHPRIQQVVARAVEESESQGRTARALQNATAEAASRLLRLLQKADETWQNAGDVDHWVRSPLRFLGGRTPAALALESEEGLQRVMLVIERIDYGIFS